MQFLTIPSQTYTLGIKLYTEKNAKSYIPRVGSITFQDFYWLYEIYFWISKSYIPRVGYITFGDKHRILGFEDVAPRCGKVFGQWFVVYNFQ